MEKSTLKIPDISCGHCVNAVKSELEEMDGVSAVTGVPEDKTVTVQWDPPATLDAIRDKLKEINYPAE